MAVVIGASAFGLFWSSKVEAYGGGGGGTYCNNDGSPATMCYTPTNTTVPNVSHTNQSINLSSGKYMCGACPTSGH